MKQFSTDLVDSFSTLFSSNRGSKDLEFFDLLAPCPISKHHSTSTTFSKNYHFFKRKSGSCTIFLNFEYKYRNIVHPPPFHQNVVEVLWCLLSVESKLHSTFTTFSEKLPKIVKKSKMAVVLWCLLSIESKHHSTTTTFSGNFWLFWHFMLMWNIVQLPLFHKNKAW